MRARGSGDGRGPNSKAGLFGIEMSGYSPTYGFSWRECIQPDGETLYETPDGVMQRPVDPFPGRGRPALRMRTTGMRTPACYLTGRQTAKGLRFEGEFNSLFITTKVVKGVKTCNPDDLIG